MGRLQLAGCADLRQIQLLTDIRSIAALRGVLQVAFQVGLQPPADPGYALGHRGERMLALVLSQSGAQQLARAGQPLGGETCRARLFSQAFERLTKRRVREAPTRQRLGLGLEVTRAQHALHKPLHRAARPRLQAGRRPQPLPAQVCQHARIAQRPDPLLRPRTGFGGYARRDLTQRSPGTRLVEISGEEVADVVHEQRAGRRQAIVVGGVPAQHQQLPRT